MATALLDTFTAAFSSDVTTHTSDSGHTWYNTGAVGSWWLDAASGTFTFPYTYGYQIATNIMFSKYTMQVDFVKWAQYDNVVLRYYDSNNWVRIMRSYGSFTVQQNFSGSTTVRTNIAVASDTPGPVTLKVTSTGASFDVEITLLDTGQVATGSFTTTVSTDAVAIGFASQNGQSVVSSISATEYVNPIDLAATLPLILGVTATAEAANVPYADLAGEAQLAQDGTGVLSIGLSFDAVLGLDLTVDDPVVLSGAQEAGNGPRPDGPDRLALNLTFAARFALDYPLAPSLAGGTALTRAMLGVAADVQVPTIVAGKPGVSPFWAVEDSTSSVTGIQIIPLPDPPPLPPKKPSLPDPVQYRWLSKDQPLNDQWIESWPAHGGGPAWKSLFPFRPKLKAHIHYGAKGKKYTHSNAVFFNPAYVEHMWLDMGHALVQPYTWIFAVIILGYPAGDYRQYLLDAGKAQKTSTISKVRKGYNVNDGLSYRNTLIADRKQLIVGTSNSGPVTRAPHTYAPRPRVFAGVYDGDSSYSAVMDEKSAKIVKGRVSSTKPRYFVSGRKQNRIDTDDAAHFMIFEIRLIENAALTPAELRKHYKQLASTYKFNSY